MEKAAHFCPFVWEDLSLKNNGDIRPCCNYEGSGTEKILLGKDGQALNFRDTNHSDTLNHPMLKAMRAQFLAGHWPKGCWRCQTTESVGLNSLRSHRISRAQKRGDLEELVRKIHFFTTADGTVTAEHFPTKEIDIRFNNNCNLRCRHCGPESSSSWYQDAYRFGDKEIYESGELLMRLEERDGRIVASYDRSDWSKDVSFRERVSELSKVKRIYFAGGEPLLQAKHLELLEALIESGSARDIELEYNTNLSFLPEKVLRIWEEFAGVGVGVSIEGVEDHYEYIRFPAKFSRLVDNLQRLDAGGGHIRAWFSFTVNVLSICHLPEAMNWVVAQKFRKIGNKGNRPPVSLRMLYNPEFLCVQNMPSLAKRYAEKKIQDSLEMMSKAAVLDPQKFTAIENSLNGILDFMYKKESLPHWLGLWAANQQLDQWRKQNFSAIEPVFSQLLAQEDPSPRAFSSATNSL
jgi:pyruvate-formate lyase-activating enzyme